MVVYIRRFRPSFVGRRASLYHGSMRVFRKLRRWLANNIDTEVESPTATSADSDAQTTIDDPEATSLRAIKLPDSEREACDVEERER